MNIVGEIRWHLGDNNARLKYSESKEAFSIDTILVPATHRQQGIATRLINHVLLLADALNKNVYVAARPLGQSNEAQLLRLVEFYKRFHFRCQDRGLSVVYMVRSPRPSRAALESIDICQ